MSARTSRGALRLIDSDARPLGPTAWFCGHCGAPPENGPPEGPGARVCASCGLGLLHQTAEDEVPRPEEAFAIVDSSLTVQAISSTAESIFGLTEAEIVNRPVTALFLPADAEADGPSSLASSIFAAATGGDSSPSLFVRPATTFGVRLQVRVVACGPPAAALVVLR